MENKRIQTDALVIGSGLAGIFAALKIADKHAVMLLTKKGLTDSNSYNAQGGIASVTTDTDSFEKHTQDTLLAGAGLCDKKAVQQIIHSGPEQINKIVQLGVHFTKRSEIETTNKNADEYDLGKEGGHSKRRVLHVGDITGRHLEETLIERCKEHKNITILENHMAVDLIVSKKLDLPGKNRSMGAYILDCKTNSVHTFLSNTVVLATGGAGKVYLYTTNPDVASGDGIAMGYRAYAEIANMEFFQFHPTCLYHPDAKSFLISEAVRGEGAVLKKRHGNKYIEFMHKYHKLESLAPRDIVARAIDRELKNGGEECVYLDITHHKKTFLKRRFPNIYDKCLEYGIDMSTDMIPVVPAAHYCCGGIKTDVNGVTGINGFYAIGEVACTGLHGANRLASNSLLEALVTADNASKHLIETNPTIPKEDFNNVNSWNPGNAVDSDEQVVISHNWDEIRHFMWDYVGIFRTKKRLERAKHRVRNIRQEIEQYYWNFNITPDLIELRNIASLAEMIIDSASARKESRGLHYNADYPKTNDEKMKCFSSIIKHKIL
ncbi:MAG: L-aspartate oxidase [Verrucomicrobiota bacterium]|nr:L-aspartate oxidase [Verrucomicrobiota bacterium]